jgi:hypothetical protein
MASDLKPEKPLNNNYLILPVAIAVIVLLVSAFLFFAYLTRDYDLGSGMAK